MSNLERMLKRVRAGEIEFGRFVEGTRREYRAMACYLMRRWATPAWYGLADVEQELYLETWRKLDTFDPARSTDADKVKGLQRYIVFNAMSAAKRAMHVARGVAISGSPDKKASCFETPLSHYANGGDREGAASAERWLESILSGDDPNLARVGEVAEVRAAATAALKACETMHERYAVLAIREAGSLDNAPAVLYDDLDHRLDLRLGSEEKAERFVFKHAKAVAARVAAATAR